MKIVGVAYWKGRQEMYLKPDSALLVNGKPFFLPAFSEEVEMHPCKVVRICRMGRNIETRFAERYYDAYTLGLNMLIPSLLDDDKWGSKVQGSAFDNSMVVGSFWPMQEQGAALIQERGGLPVQELSLADTIISLAEAVSFVSRYITLRMGDLIAVDYMTEAMWLTREDKWVGRLGKETVLSCKIK